MMDIHEARVDTELCRRRFVTLVQPVERLSVAVHKAAPSSVLVLYYGVTSVTTRRSFIPIPALSLVSSVEEKTDPKA